MDPFLVLILAGMALYLWSTSTGQTFTNFFQPSASAAGDGSSSSGGQAAPAGGGILSTVQIAQLATAAGFAGNDLITAVAVALAESSGDPNAYGDRGQYCCSFGLWQINSYYHPEFGPTFSMLFDPATNAAAAYSVYVRAGNSFSPWTGTFGTGIYLKYVPTVQAALA